MGQVSPSLRSIKGGYSHWCPACKELHMINVNDPNLPRWTFDGNVVAPTFGPSVHVSGLAVVRDAQGKWTGEWVRDANGNTVPYICHYFIKAGNIEFCGDCTHEFSGRTVPLPTLPAHLQDPE